MAGGRSGGKVLDTGERSAVVERERRGDWVE